MTSSSQHPACGWSDHDVRRYGRVMRKSSEGEVEERREALGRGGGRGTGKESD